MTTTYQELRQRIAHCVPEVMELKVKHREEMAGLQRRLGALLREYRKMSGMSLRFVAESVGVSAAYLSDVELGQRSISEETIDFLLSVIPDPTR